MHVYNPDYAAPSDAAVLDLVRHHPVGLLVSGNGDAAPTATHVPIILDPHEPGPPRLTGATLHGHMARSNPHWQTLTTPRPVLAVFTSGHGYVSPSSYGHTPAVPTVNYAAVHATGRLTLLDAAENLRVVRDTVTTMERRRDPQWDMTASLELFASIAPQIVAFRIEVDDVTALFKLSQDKPADVRERVGHDLATTEASPEVAALMATYDPDRTG